MYDDILCEIECYGKLEVRLARGWKWPEWSKHKVFIAYKMYV